MGYTFAIDNDNPTVGGNILEGDPLTYSPAVWRYIIDRFAVRSIMDLGSGLGYAAEYFFRRGIRTVAIDGLPSNIDKSLYPTVYIDLARNAVNCTVDLVHCQEVVEHVEEQYLDNVLISLACGRFIVMSHGEPGQGGYYHVNLQTPDYWIEHLRKVGFHLLPEDTTRVRKLAVADGASHLARSGLVFAKDTT